MRLHFIAFLVLFTFSFVNSARGQDIELSYIENREQVQRRITLLENSSNLIPLKGLDTLRIASLCVGVSSLTPFQNMLGNYAPIDFYNLSAGYSHAQVDSLMKILNKYNLVLLGVHTNQIPSANFSANLKSRCITVCFVNPRTIPELSWNSDGLILAYKNDELTQELAAQLIFGGIEAKGKLTETVWKYPEGYGLATGSPVRLSYSAPEAVGINSASLTFTIDSIIDDAIHQKAFPGCNILIAKEGKVIFHKTYGYHTYDNIVPVNKKDIYDLASVTKVSAALPAIMKLTEEGKLNLDEKFSVYWPDWNQRLFHRSNKEDLKVRELLAHQAGLEPFINFWQQTQKNGKVLPKWYRVEEEKEYSLMVAPGMYLKNDFKKRVYRTIRLSELKNRGKYVYSDLFFILAPEVISRLSGENYLRYLDSCFYRPLGANTFTYLPTRKFSTERIVPTESDTYYRKRLLLGSVHDEASAVFGGISGNAGLFSSANDLAKLLQMYLQKGSYGGKEYLKKETLQEFTRVQFPQNNNRRGLGFDKPLPNNSTLSLKDSYPSPDASPESYGHSGYTGTFCWIDPQYQLVYIILTNRVYPTRENTKITELSIRTKVQQVIYDEIKDSLQQ